MKKLTTTLCLTVALLFGCAGVCKSNDFNVKAMDAIKCAAIYMIATSITANNKVAAKAFADLQKTFVGVYSAIKGQGRRLTNGEISKAKSKAMRSLGRGYDRNPRSLHKLEMRCNAWRALISKAFSGMSRNTGKRAIMRAFRNISPMPEVSPRDPRWPHSKKLVDMSIAVWTKAGRMTPQAFKDSLRKSLRR